VIVTKTPDWIAIEVDYRAGVVTLEAIGKQHGLSKGRISQVAKERGWIRDLSAKIAARTEARLNKSVLNEELNKQRSFSEERVVEANAKLQSDIILGQRQDVVKLRDLVNDLMGELAHQTGYRELYEQLGELLQAPDEKGIDRLNEVYRKVISLPSRIDGAKKLVDAFDRLVERERQVFNIDKQTGQEPPNGLILQISGQNVDVKALGWG
jgi:hypothetical protein